MSDTKPTPRDVVAHWGHYAKHKDLDAFGIWQPRVHAWDRGMSAAPLGSPIRGTLAKAIEIALTRPGFDSGYGYGPIDKVEIVDADDTAEPEPGRERLWQAAERLRDRLIKTDAERDQLAGALRDLLDDMEAICDGPDQYASMSEARAALKEVDE